MDITCIIFEIQSYNGYPHIHNPVALPSKHPNRLNKSRCTTLSISPKISHIHVLYKRGQIVHPISKSDGGYPKTNKISVSHNLVLGSIRNLFVLLKFAPIFSISFVFPSEKQNNFEKIATIYCQLLMFFFNTKACVMLLTSEQFEENCFNLLGLFSP